MGVTDAIVQIQTDTPSAKEVTCATSQAGRAALELSSKAERLHGVVSRFQLEESAGTGTSTGHPTSRKAA